MRDDNLMKHSATGLVSLTVLCIATAGHAGEYPYGTVTRVDGLQSNISSEIQVADLDGDGDGDILMAGGGDDLTTKPFWLENDDGAFVQHNIDPENNNALELLAADMDGDGDLDIVSSAITPTTWDSISGIFWYENTEGGKFWTRHDVAKSAKAKCTVGCGPYSGSALAVGDINGDGNADIFTADYVAQQLVVVT